MSAGFPLEILPQPNDTTCGPTCLHAVYGYYGDRLSLEQVVAEVATLQEGGTLAVFLACHALRRGYQATIYTYNLQVFDPTWFDQPGVDLCSQLRTQMQQKTDDKLYEASEGYLTFLELGGTVRYEDLTLALIRKQLLRGRPILTGLSATYLYREMREFGPDCQPDAVRGLPVGHFVVLCGYSPQTREVLVADPIHPNPLSNTRIYPVGIQRVLGAIFLGIVTHDANLLILEPRKTPTRRKRASP